ncbi:hypothetical protein SO802_001731 [Lithocarpus litseifolius]|uniref:Protein FAR1-RELATED SEQUENCE n=1 Tax=Lithocarpus litseifolius TaxID=425828 RepID=A0AAW2DV86_9ROSI
MQNPANQRSNNEATQALKQRFGLNPTAKASGGGECSRRGKSARTELLHFGSSLSLSQPDLQKSNPLRFWYILKRWTKDAKKNSVVCDHAKSAYANDELSMTLRRNELICSVYEIFTRSAATTRHTKMCKRKIREMIELVEKDMEELSVARDDGEGENSFVDNTISGDVEKTNCLLNNLPILDPPCVRPKGVTNARMKSNMKKRKRKALKDITR